MIIPSALLILLDQFTKIEAAARLAGKSPFVIIPGALEFYYIENTGAAWGMMAGARTFFIILTVIVIAAVVPCCDADSRPFPVQDAYDSRQFF